MQELIKDVKEWAGDGRKPGSMYRPRSQVKNVFQEKSTWLLVSNTERQSKMETGMPLNLALCNSLVTLEKLILGEKIRKSVIGTLTIISSFVS